MKGSKEAAERVRACRQLERSIDELPVLPTVVAKLMVLDQDADDFFDSLLALVESDPNFSTRILAAANSSASGSRSDVASVRAALTRIGSKNASSRLLAMAVTKVFVPRDDWERSLWRHALQVASLAKILARECGDPDVNPDKAYLAARRQLHVPTNDNYTSPILLVQIAGCGQGCGQVPPHFGAAVHSFVRSQLVVSS